VKGGGKKRTIERDVQGKSEVDQDKGNSKREWNYGRKR